jgi:hypothetical protein
MADSSLPAGQEPTNMASLKSSSGQSELLVSVLLIILASSVAVAYNATNPIDGAGFLTGHILNDSLNLTPETLTKSVESSAIVQVWARTSLSVGAEKLADSLLLKATLSLDNGSLVGGQEVDFYLDDAFLGSNSTDPSGMALLHLYNATGRHAAGAHFNGSDSLRYDSSYGSADIDAGPMNVTPAAPGWASYDPETGIITLAGDGTHCTQESPCTLSDIYQASQENGWNSVENYGTFFILHSGLRIGDGLNETHLASSFEQVRMLKPWEVMPLASLQFGLFSEEQGGYGYGGSMVDVDIPEQDQLEHNSAIKVDEGGSLGMYETKYKVYGPAENSIYMDDGSSFDGWRFDIQRVYKDAPGAASGMQTGASNGASQASAGLPQVGPSTTLRLPRNATAMHGLKTDDVTYECADASFCQSLEAQE